MNPFPDGRFDSLTLLATTIPSFWTEVYEGRELVLDLLRGFSRVERQIDQTSDELLNSMGRLTCPVYHADFWYPIDLAASDGKSSSVIRYGDELVYGPQPDTNIVYQFGRPANAAWEFPLPAALVACYGVTDSPVDAGVLLTPGLEFMIPAAGGKIVFAVDPFKDDRFMPYLDDDGLLRLRLYLSGVQWDWSYVAKLYGEVAGINGRSSERFKQLVNAVLDASATGSTHRHLLEVLEAVLDSPLARGDESVVDVSSDYLGPLVLTDERAYRLPPGSTSVVEVGDALLPGQALSNGVSLAEVRQGVLPTGLQYLAAGNGILAAPFGELVFANEEVPLEVQTGVSGFTRVSFRLGGWPAVVTSFFDEVHTRGVAAGQTLANYLDLRTSPAAQPTADNLPKTINPLKFLISNLLRANICIINLKPGMVGPDAVGLAALGAIRKVLPPHVAVIVIIDLEATPEEITMDDSGDADAPGVAEAYALSLV